MGYNRLNSIVTDILGYHRLNSILTSFNSVCSSLPIFGTLNSPPLGATVLTHVVNLTIDWLMAEPLFLFFCLFVFPQSPLTIERKKESSSTVAIAGDELEDQPATTTADEDFIKKLVRERPLVLVTAGKPGAGKSTLINNLLGLKGKKAAESKADPESVTKAVDYYEEEVRGITVRIIDTPGLEAKDLSREAQEALEDLSALTDGKADIMLYCMKLADRSRADKKDERIVRKLTRVFGKEVWRHTVLVLTYGDAVLNEDEGDRGILERFTNEFEMVLLSLQ